MRMSWNLCSDGKKTMKTHRKNSLNSRTLRQLNRMKPADSGHVLLYVVVLTLIFGVLGVVMVSLFTTSTASSVTRNDSRRALHMYESGMRYAFSEIRKADFDRDFINTTLNTTTYNVADAGSFTINVFSPWFESPSGQSSSPYTLNITEGTLPTDFNVPANLWVFNLERMEVETDYTPARTPVTAYTRVDDTTLRLNLNGDFIVSPGNRVCIGVMPSHTQNSPPLQEGDDLYVERVAKDFFPKFNGAVNINRVDYSPVLGCNRYLFSQEGGNRLLPHIQRISF